jgi:IclR family transcriptional regulator, mhp operon transcriptional activator
MKPARVKSIQSLARGLEVLQLIQTVGALSLHDLHRMSGIPKASLLRILKTLSEQGMIWQRILDDHYIPSYSLSELANRVDRESRLVEVASPVLEALTQEVKWPSVLAAPRLTCMEVIEANTPRSYFHHIPLGPLGFQINMLRSATGRAYIAFCEDARREAILDALRRTGRKGDLIAAVPELVAEAIAQTREQGFGLRHADFGGSYDEGRNAHDDGRDSIGIPIIVGNSTLGAINITWAKKVLSRAHAIDRFVEPLKTASAAISQGLIEAQGNFTR